jgi:hypothetical protein
MRANIPVWPVANNEIKLKRKHTRLKPGNKGMSKKNNSGQTGRKAKAAKRARVVSSNSSPEQYGRWKAMMDSSGEKVLG